MVKLERQSDSLFRPVPATLRLRTYTFRFAAQEQPPKLSDSLVNSGGEFNRPVRLGAYRDFELVCDGRAA